MPFEDSRRLTGSNLFFASTGAVLELVRVVPDDVLLDDWRARVERARRSLGWPAGRSRDPVHADATEAVARLHKGGASLAVTAPCDQLFTATELNEWALCAALHERDPQQWSGIENSLRLAAEDAAESIVADDPPLLDEALAVDRLRRLAGREARRDLLALVDAAIVRNLAYLLDDSTLTLGAGAGSRSYPLDRLPEAGSVPWSELRNIPTAVVTGSNGKTTTVRLIAACAAEHGWRTGYNCTDGIFVANEPLATGDYAGPAGARRVMRHTEVRAAVLETARGGILRRGLAINRADAAVVTNVSPDHFGEYGIHDLDALADVKLTVASVVSASGLLVLNADDALLRSKAGGLSQRYGHRPAIGWFSQDADSAWLSAHRERGGWTCGVRDGRLQLFGPERCHDLGEIKAMPLTAGGSADYNVANLAAAALAAAAIGVAPGAIAAVFGRFGRSVSDNAGRLMRFDVRGVTVLVDYAHNPDGIRGLLRVAQRLRTGQGRVGLMLGHAGNRQDDDIRAVARVAAEFGPDLVVVKEDESYLRGRAPGEVPALIHATLVEAGLPCDALRLCMSEIEAVRCALEWARPGDVLALPVHGADARRATLELLAGSG